MQFKPHSLAIAAAIALGSAAIPAAAETFEMLSTAVPEFGTPPPSYGTVTLTQIGSRVDFSVALRSDLNFVTTGNHYVFSFNSIGVATNEIVNIFSQSPGVLFAATGTGAGVTVVNPPFGTFTYGISCSFGCSNGTSGGGYADPLTFSVLNSTIDDFRRLSTGAGSLGPAYFAADVGGVVRNSPSFQFTGAIGATAVTPVPEPETYAMMLAGLGVLGFMAKRRKRV